MTDTIASATSKTITHDCEGYKEQAERHALIIDAQDEELEDLHQQCCDQHDRIADLEAARGRLAEALDAIVALGVSWPKPANGIETIADRCMLIARAALTASDRHAAVEIAALREVAAVAEAERRIDAAPPALVEALDRLAAAREEESK